MFCPSVVLLFFVSLAFALYDASDDVVVLTSSNFKNQVLQGNSNLPWLVEFYAPWCGHCKSLQPEYKKLAKKLKNIVNIGAVDADNASNRGLAGKYQIKGFPTLKVFYPDGKVVDYQGGRTASAMASFMTALLSSKVELIRTKNEAVFLEGEQYKVLLFTTKEKTTTLFKSLSQRFAGRLKFGEVSSADNDLVVKYEVSEFPSLFVLKESSEPIKYAGAMKPGDIIKFLEQYASPAPKQSKSSPKEKKHDGRNWSVQLTDSNFDDLVMNSKSAWMVEFFAPWCGHCKALAPKWTKAAASLKNVVRFGTVDCTVETKLAQRFGIKGYPSIKFFRAGHKHDAIDYQGAREAKAISSFASTLLPDNVQKITPETQQIWVSGSDKPSLLLLSSKSSTPSLFKSLAVEFSEFVQFGAILNAKPEMLDSISQSKENHPPLKLPALFAFVHVDDERFGVLSYFGPLGMEQLSLWIREVFSLNSSSDTKSSLQKDYISVVEAKTQKDFDEECGTKLGLCVIAFPYGGWETLSHAKDQFWAAADSEMEKSTSFRFMWMDGLVQSEFVEKLRLPDDGSIGLVALHPRKKRMALFVGSFTTENISEFLENVLRGRISTSALDALPSMIDSGADLNGSCESTSSSDKEQCTMPEKDEL